MTDPTPAVETPSTEAGRRPIERWIASLHEDTNGLVWITKQEIASIVDADDEAREAAAGDVAALREALRNLRLNVWHADYCAPGDEQLHCICGLSSAITVADAALSDAPVRPEPPLCVNCHHAYGAHDGWTMGGSSRRDWSPRWGSACGSAVDSHHTCACSRYVAAERSEADAEAGEAQR